MLCELLTLAAASGQTLSHGSDAVAVAGSDTVRLLGRDVESLIGLLAVGGGLLVAITAIVLGTLTGVSKRRLYEESRREIAAYVAEGSIRPEDAERILKTGKKID